MGKPSFSPAGRAKTGERVYNDHRMGRWGEEGNASCGKNAEKTLSTQTIFIACNIFHLPAPVLVNVLSLTKNRLS